MTDAANVLAGFQKNLGATVGGYGTVVQEFERQPSGIFEFDMATGGGWLKGKIAEIMGVESVGKTNLLLKTIATAQKLEPDKKAVFIDVENMLDLSWAAKLGVDTKNLIVMRPDFADQAVDMAEAFVATDDVSIIGLDSIASMISEKELEAESGKQYPGGTSYLSGKLVRKVTVRQSQQSKAGKNVPTFIVINQIRYKIGVIMGNPETTSGGQAPKHAFSLRVRMSGEDITDTAVSKTLPVKKASHFRLKKWKTSVISATGKYEMVTVPHDGLMPGDCDDGNSVIGYMKKCGVLEQVKGGWQVFDEPFKTQEQIKAKLRDDLPWGLAIKSGLIKAMMAGGEVIPAGGSNE